jgi:hypothetical protein
MRLGAPENGRLKTGRMKKDQIRRTRIRRYNPLESINSADLGANAEYAAAGAGWGSSEITAGTGKAFPADKTVTVVFSNTSSGQAREQSVGDCRGQ